LGEDVGQRQIRELVVLSTAVGKQTRRSAAPQVAKGHFHGALRELLEDLAA
jgi:hypothetical protein